MLRLAIVLGSVLALAATACEGEADSSPEAGTSPASSASADRAATNPAAPAAAFPLRITDAGGTEVALDAPPRAIVSYSPGATEILFAIGAGQSVVAVDEFSNFPSEVDALPTVTYSNPDPEAALAFDPDLVLLSTQQSEQVRQFRDAGMTVVYLASADSLQGVYDQIDLLGRVTGREEAAAAVVADMRSRIDAVTGRLQDVEEGPRVFFELSPELYSVAPDSFVGGLLEVVKARNVAAGAASQFPQLTSEAVVAADPEVVLLADPETPDSVAARPGWSGVSAVVEGRVISIDPDLSNRPGPRLADAIEEIARALYPDRFP